MLLEESAFLPPFAPPALPGFFARMAALTPGEPHKSGTFLARSPVFTSQPFPDILPSTTSAAPPVASVSCDIWSWLRLSLAGSPFCSCRIMFICIAVYLVHSVALHPASRRRSYFLFSVRDRPNWSGSLTPLGCAAPQRTRDRFPHRP
jgi:hypothetical protein